MRDVRTIILAAVSRSELCYVSENEGFRLGKKDPILRKCVFVVHYTQDPTKLLRSRYEVVTKLLRSWTHQGFLVPHQPPHTHP